MGVASLSVAGVELSASAAADTLASYGRLYHATVRYYDFNGDPSVDPAGTDGVRLADIARLVLINASISSQNVPELMKPLKAELWSAVPVDADFLCLPDDPTNEPVYVGVSELYRSFRSLKGVGRTTTTKLLHLKRPGLVPIIDSVTAAAYHRAAADYGRALGKPPLIWAAVWADARRNAEALDQLRPSVAARGELEALVARLPLLRLLDILAWSSFHSRD